MPGRPLRRVEEALRAVPRERYLPPEVRPFAHRDEALPIGWGSTNSQPWTVRFMLRLLDARPGMRVLDVGAGSGWTTDLLAWLVGPTGRVVGTEVIPEVVARTRGVLQAPNAELRLVRPDTLGAPDAAPFDRILVSADAGRIPPALVAQLAVGGRMVLPASGKIVVVTAPRPGVSGIHQAPGDFRFVPLLWAHE